MDYMHSFHLTVPSSAAGREAGRDSVIRPGHYGTTASSWNIPHPPTQEHVLYIQRCSTKSMSIEDRGLISGS